MRGMLGGTDCVENPWDSGLLPIVAAITFTKTKGSSVNRLEVGSLVELCTDV
jgi:hypothetical protein